MDNKEIGKNIVNSFKVVQNTYLNLLKMISELDEVFSEEHIILTPKYLRYRSDLDPNGLFISSFIKLYQNKELGIHSKCNELRNGPVIGIEINFLNSEIPQVKKLMYFYENIDSDWSGLPSVSEHWGFYNPIYNKNQFNITSEGKVFKSIARDDKIKNTYWNLKEVIYIEKDLVDLDSKDKLKKFIKIEF